MSHVKPRTTSIVIYQGDDLERLGELRREADIAERIAQEALDDAERQSVGVSRRAGDPDPMVEARAAFDAAVKPSRDAYDTFVDEAAERALVVEVRAIGRRRFRQLLAEHPARTVTRKGDDGKETEEVHEDDRMFSVNADTFPSALLAYIDPDDMTVRTITAPDFKGRREVEAFLDDELAEGDFDKLWISAYYLNRNVGADPKAARYSTDSLRSSAT